MLHVTQYTEVEATNIDAKVDKEASVNSWQNF